MNAAAKKKAKTAPKSASRTSSKVATAKPAGKKPAVKKPAAKAAPAKKPVAKKPAAKKPVPKAAAKPVAKKPAPKAAAKPVAKKPVPKAAAKPVAKKPAPKAAAKPVAKKPAAKPVSKPVVKNPSGQSVTKNTSSSKVPATKTSPAKTTSASQKPTSKATATPKSPAAVTHPAPVAPPALGADGRKLSARAAKAMSLVPPPPGQSFASTTAKASYSRAESLPPPLVPLAVKKNPKLANNWQSKPVEALTDEEVLAMPDDAYMNAVQLAFFRLRLQGLKQDILNNAGETTEHLREDTVIVPDPADRATIEEEHALELRTRDRERKLLKKIEQSIALIDSGDYGYCDETGEPIGVGRLLARPTATLSLEAQQRRELKQKMFGD